MLELEELEALEKAVVKSKKYIKRINRVFDAHIDSENDDEINLREPFFSNLEQMLGKLRLFEKKLSNLKSLHDMEKLDSQEFKRLYEDDDNYMSLPFIQDIVKQHKNDVVNGDEIESMTLAIEDISKKFNSLAVKNPGLLSGYETIDNSYEGMYFEKTSPLNISDSTKKKPSALSKLLKSSKKHVEFSEAVKSREAKILDVYDHFNKHHDKYIGGSIPLTKLELTSLKKSGIDDKIFSQIYIKIVDSFEELLEEMANDSFPPPENVDEVSSLLRTACDDLISISKEHAESLEVKLNEIAWLKQSQDLQIESDEIMDESFEVNPIAESKEYKKLWKYSEKLKKKWGKQAQAKGTAIQEYLNKMSSTKDIDDVVTILNDMLSDDVITVNRGMGIRKPTSVKLINALDDKVNDINISRGFQL